MFRRRPRSPQLDKLQFTPWPDGGIVVGGAVRDALLGRDFNDVDWLVADPERAAREVAQLWDAAVFPIDERRGHWRVSKEGEVRDFAPLHGDLETNLKQRDFTMNAVALNAEGKLIDPLNGAKDIAAKRVRMVSRENLFDDPLRALRAVRLGAELGFKLEPRTQSALKEVALAQLEGDLKLSAAERSSEELNRILLSPNAAQGFELLDELRLLDVYLPELSEARTVTQGGFHHLNVLGHSLEALHQLQQIFSEADLALRWATLLHDVGKPPTKTYDESQTYYNFYGHDKLGGDITRSVLKRLRQPSERISKASALVRYHMVQLPETPKTARRFVHRRRELLPDLLSLMIADREAARGPRSSEASRKRYRLAMGTILGILNEPQAPAPLLSGREIMKLLELGPGPRVGEAVRFLAEAEAVKDIATRAEAKAALKNFAKKQGWRKIEN